ncbi:G-protein coupled receptor Mth2-like [Chironomus tepperi]|uniref:G-protein coupled receptor Mth2-like n=1 Tax=Chironomus tepperi TaxID=113505 RepID=UPI00391FA05C
MCPYFVPDKYNNKIGVKSCKIFANHDKLPKIIYIYGPLAFCLIVNTILYILTSIKIYKHQQNTTAYRRGTSCKIFSKKNINFNKSSLYMRLAIVMGVHWIVEVSSSLIGDPRLYFVAFVLFNMQGPIIFLTFVCNTRVKYILNKRFNKTKKFASRDALTEMEMFIIQIGE